MQTDVLCLGEMLWDCLADQPDRPEAEVVSWTSYPGGAPANVACALARLGTDSTFVGCLGEDEAGEGLLTTLRHYRVQTHAVQRDPLATRRVYVTRTTAGERHFASFGGLPADQFADTRLASDQLDPEWFERTSFLVIGSLMMAFPKSSQAVLHALDLADEQFVKVFLDVNWRPVFWEEPSQALETVYALIERSDLLKLSEEEAEWLQLPTLNMLSERFDHLEGIFITRGARGCAWQVGSVRGEHAGFSVATVDTTGAGDAFTAGLLQGFAHNSLRDWEALAPQIVQYACAVGALSTLAAGAIASMPSDAEVQAFLAARVR